MKKNYVLSYFDEDREYTEALFDTYEEAAEFEKELQADGLETFGIERL